MQPRFPFVLFADADSMLRTPNSPSRLAGLSLPEYVVTNGVPLVLCSGRTRAELELIGQAIGSSHPFVSENGSGVFIPDRYFGFPVRNAHKVAGYDVVEFGAPYGQTIETLHATAGRLRVSIVGFSNMSVEEVALDAGLPLMGARLAKLREYVEPFRLLEPDTADRQRLLKALLGAGVRCTPAGKYDHAGSVIDSGQGIALLTSLFRRAFGSVLTVALGNVLNDRRVLHRVDVSLDGLDDVDGLERLGDRLQAGRGPANAWGAGRP